MEAGNEVEKLGRTNIWASQAEAVIRNFSFIPRVIEMHWRILGWGVTCFSKSSLAVLYREKSREAGRGEENGIPWGLIAVGWGKAMGIEAGCG